MLNSNFKKRRDYQVLLAAQCLIGDHHHNIQCTQYTLPNWPGSMIRIVVVATDSVNDMPSKQFTTVPFMSPVTGLTTILDISGELS